MTAQPLLFLIADTGGGHRASANAVRSQFEVDHPGEFDIHIVDPFAGTASPWLRHTTDLYGTVIQHASWMWGALYYSTNSKPAVSLLKSTVLRSVESGLARLCQRLQPAAVVSFHPLLNHVAARAVRRPGVTRVPLITVITDLVDVHAAWACRDVDAVVTPSPGGLDRARRVGIPGERCFPFGLPVDVSFTRPPLTPDQRSALRLKLGVAPDGFVVLLCGGADGSGGIARRARALAKASLPIELVVICGRNRSAQKRLAGLCDHRGSPVAVHGFVNNMAEWVRTADVIATKAGPGTIAEALCCQTPLLLTWYLHGQERGNVDWVVDTGAGRYVPDIDQLVDTVAEFSRPGSPGLARLREAVMRVARPEATADIAELIVSMARGGIVPRS